MRNAEAQTTDLFPDLTLPRLLPDESLYSWCARFHRLSGNTRARETSYELFGHPTAGLRPDFPTHLYQFQRNTQNVLAPDEELIFQHTQVGLHRPFLTPTGRQSVIQRMSTGESRSIRQRLGLTRSGVGTPLSLRACPNCCLDDQSVVPSSYWRIEHQWAPVWICIKHKIALQEYAPPLRKGILDGWYLPNDISMEQWKAPRPAGRAVLERLETLARWTNDLIQDQFLQFEDGVLRHTYLLHAKTHNWIAMDGSLRFSALRDAFIEAHRGLECWPAMGFLKDVAGSNGGFLGLLLRDYPGVRHPIKHILLMSFLFSDLDELAGSYEEVKSIIQTEGPPGIEKRLSDTKTRLRQMVEIEGRSVNASSMALGIPPAQALRQLKKDNISYHRRPRVLTPQIREQLTQMLQCGEERLEIATRLGLRKAYIKDYLAQHPTLREEWKARNTERRIEDYRKRFLETLSNNPGVPIKRIKRIPGNGFQWLSKNDPDWLKANMPSIWGTRKSPCPIR